MAGEAKLSKHERAVVNAAKRWRVLARVGFVFPYERPMLRAVERLLKSEQSRKKPKARGTKR